MLQEMIIRTVWTAMVRNTLKCARNARREYRQMLNVSRTKNSIGMQARLVLTATNVKRTC